MDSDAAPLFNGDDYQLIAEAACREEERRDLFKEVHGVAAPEDDLLDRLADLATRLRQYLERAQS